VRLDAAPPIEQPHRQFASAGLRQVQQQLREIVLRVNAVPAAGAGQACQDRRRPPAARVAHE